MRDPERPIRIQHALEEASLDALIATLPANVLLLTGYWPVVGASIAIAAREQRTIVLAPEDERELAQQGWAGVQTFLPSSLDRLTSAMQAAHDPLQRIAGALGLARARIGYEGGTVSEPASYSAMLVYGAAILDLIRAAIPGAFPVAADGIFRCLRAVKTPSEIEGIRAACAVAARAFLHGASQLCAGLTEAEAACLFRAPLSTQGIAPGGTNRADGFVYCMSGPNAAQAYGAFARTRQRPITAGDLVLVHCNSYVDGFWTDVTRTYIVGPPDQRQRELYQAVLAARIAALNAIRPGARAAGVDAAARQELSGRGFGGAFRHSTGHGIGFGAIDHDALPRLHPKSPDLLQPGMVINVEPAIYIPGYGGIRHCDMVVVTAEGMQLLTPFHANLRHLSRETFASPRQ